MSCMPSGRLPISSSTKTHCRSGTWPPPHGQSSGWCTTLHVRGQKLTMLRVWCCSYSVEAKGQEVVESGISFHDAVLQTAAGCRRGSERGETGVGICMCCAVLWRNVGRCGIVRCWESWQVVEGLEKDEKRRREGWRRG